MTSEPSLTREQIDRLGDEIAELSAHIDAATYRLLELLREFDRAQAWGQGFITCAHWLSWRTGSDLGAAREKVRVARALGALPMIGEAMRRGTLSYSKARAITRVATPENEASLLEFACQGTVAHVERLIRAWRLVDRNEEQERERERHAARFLSIVPDGDGMYDIRGKLDPEVATALRRALEAASWALYRKGSEEERAVPAPARRADAIGLVAERALEGRRADPGTSGADHYADHYMVVIHTEEAALDRGSEGNAVLEDGTRVSYETLRRISCDASRVRMAHGPDGSVLDVGRKTRIVPPALRRALAHRDGGCRFPGCGSRFCDAHHVRHWKDGGETNLDNLVMLCRRHHRALHEDGFAVEMVKGAPIFRMPGGEVIEEAPRPAVISGDVVEEMVNVHAAMGVEPGPWSTAPRSGQRSFDLDLAMLGLRGDRATAPGAAASLPLRT